MLYRELVKKCPMEEPLVSSMAYQTLIWPVCKGLALIPESAASSRTGVIR